MDLGGAFLGSIAQQQQIDQREAMAPALLAHQIGLNKLQAAQTEHQIGLTQLNSAQAAQMNAKTAMEQKSAALLSQALGSGLIPGAEATMSQRLMGLSNIEAQAGNVVKAGDMMKAASAAQAHEETARAAIVRQGIDQFKSNAARATAIASTLEGVTDQASWDAANARFEQQFQVTSPYKNLPYDPQFVEQLKSAAMTEYEKANVGIRQADELSKDANRRSQIEHRLAMAEFAAQREARARQKAIDDKKLAGKDVGSPTPDERRAAKLLISSEGLAVGDDLDRAAFDVAAEARGLRKGNPGMTMDIALQRALKAKRDNGDFTAGESGTLGFGKKPPTYAPAQDLPASGKTSDLVVGKNYRNPTGKVMKWTKGGWVPVAGAAPPAAPRPTVPVDNVPEEDTEED